MKIHKRCRQCSIWYIVPVYSRRFNSKFCSLSCTTTFRNIHNNPTKCKKVREKIKSFAKSRDLSHLRTKSSIEKQRKSITGRKHWNWQGGKTKETILLRNQSEYKKWRKGVYERDNYTCQICKLKGGKLEADHIKPWCLYPKLRYCLENGRTLCKKCHRRTDTFGSKMRKYLR